MLNRRTALLINYENSNRNWDKAKTHKRDEVQSFSRFLFYHLVSCHVVMTTVASFEWRSAISHRVFPRQSSPLGPHLWTCFVIRRRRNPYAMPFRLPRMSRFCASLSSLLSCDTAGRKAFFFVLATSKERLNDIRLKVPLPIRIFLFWMPSVKGYVNHVFFPLSGGISFFFFFDRERVKRKKNREEVWRMFFSIFSPAGVVSWITEYPPLVSVIGA